MLRKTFSSHDERTRRKSSIYFWPQASMSNRWSFLAALTTLNDSVFLFAFFLAGLFGFPNKSRHFIASRNLSSRKIKYLINTKKNFSFSTSNWKILFRCCPLDVVSKCSVWYLFSWKSRFKLRRKIGVNCVCLFSLEHHQPFEVEFMKYSELFSSRKPEQHKNEKKLFTGLAKTEKYFFVRCQVSWSARGWKLMKYGFLISFPKPITLPLPPDKFMSRKNKRRGIAVCGYELHSAI